MHRGVCGVPAVHQVQAEAALVAHQANAIVPIHTAELPHEVEVLAHPYVRVRVVQRGLAQVREGEAVAVDALLRVLFVQFADLRACAAGAPHDRLFPREQVQLVDGHRVNEAAQALPLVKIIPCAQRERHQLLLLQVGHQGLDVLGRVEVVVVEVHDDLPGREVHAHVALRPYGQVAPEPYMHDLLVVPHLAGEVRGRRLSERLHNNEFLVEPCLAPKTVPQVLVEAHARLGGWRDH
mmetsp:Transcript_787/g.2280  ORF Transcript_787/g.2280 Transcript_787/m.2280 type:complete len:237 (+) Transcript_787:281-991(+)